VGGRVGEEEEEEEEEEKEEGEKEKAKRREYARSRYRPWKTKFSSLPPPSRSQGSTIPIQSFRQGKMK